MLQHNVQPDNVQPDNVQPDCVQPDCVTLKHNLLPNAPVKPGR